MNKLSSFVFISLLFCTFLVSASINIGETLEEDIQGVVLETPSIFQQIVGNLTHFINLTDTPVSFVGEGGNCLAVNVAENAIEFVACAASVDLSSTGDFNFTDFQTSFDLNFSDASLGNIGDLDFGALDFSGSGDFITSGDGAFGNDLNVSGNGNTELLVKTETTTSWSKMILENVFGNAIEFTMFGDDHGGTTYGIDNANLSTIITNTPDGKGIFIIGTEQNNNLSFLTNGNLIVNLTGDGNIFTGGIINSSKKICDSVGCIGDSIDGDLNVNQSDYWDDMDSINGTQMENSDSQLNIKESWLTSFGNIIWCTLTGCTISGNISASNITATEYFFGDISQTTGIQQGNLILFLTNEDCAKCAGNKTMSDSRNETEITLTNNNLGDGDTLIAEWVTGCEINKWDYIPAGSWLVHIDGIQTGGTKNVQFYYKTYIENNTCGDEVLISTSGKSRDLAGNRESFDIWEYTNETDINETQKINVKLFAYVSGGGSAPDIETYIQGDSHSRLEIPVGAITINKFVPYIGARDNLDLDDKNISASYYCNSTTCYNITSFLAEGAQLTTLTNNSMADTFHRHSELSASDGTPDAGVKMSATGVMGANTTIQVTGQINPASGKGFELRYLTASNDGSLLCYDRDTPAWLDMRIQGKTVQLESSGTPGLTLDASQNVLIPGKVNIGSGTPATSAALEVDSTTGAILFPRMTTAQRNALTAVEGMMIYNTIEGAFEYYDSEGWHVLSL